MVAHALQEENSVKTKSAVKPNLLINLGHGDRKGEIWEFKGHLHRPGIVPSTLHILLKSALLTPCDSCYMNPVGSAWQAAGTKWHSMYVC